jgi:hypothetical protein
MMMKMLQICLGRRLDDDPREIMTCLVWRFGILAIDTQPDCRNLEINDHSNEIDNLAREISS